MQMHNTVRKQQGFTIIELVVVILLLGILAATALPRFIDVTEQAHDSAFSGTAGGFTTGIALFRAQWVGRGQQAVDTVFSEYGSLRVAPAASSTGNPPVFAFGTSASGYPYALASTTLANYDADECKQVFDNILQGGNALSRSNGTTALTVTDDASILTQINGLQNAAATASDFQIFSQNILVDSLVAVDPAPAAASGNPINVNLNVPVCIYVYSAQSGNADRSFVYVPWTGRLEVYRTREALRNGLTALQSPVA
jgi:MSHA pilin protein MshB